MYKFIIKTFNQLKNDNFDQLIFGQTTPCPSSTHPPSREFENNCVSIKMAALPSELSNNECETKIETFKILLKLWRVTVKPLLV
jgi:hypothetical protein